MKIYILVISPEGVAFTCSRTGRIIDERIPAPESTDGMTRVWIPEWALVGWKIYKVKDDSKNQN